VAGHQQAGAGLEEEVVRGAADHTVIAPDLRGYGASDKPAETDRQTYSKRTMAADVVAVARPLGQERFALAGHDRGAWWPSGPVSTIPTSSRTWHPSMC
jgi:pimeloyl-ACP methyl ester carboxylesterase